jgi:hypothetical protein
MVEKMIHAVGQPTDDTGPTQPYPISFLQDKRGIYPSFGSSLDAMQLMLTDPPWRLSAIILALLIQKLFGDWRDPVVGGLGI